MADVRTPPVELNAVPVGARVAVIVIAPGVRGRVAVVLLTTAFEQANVTLSRAARVGVPVISSRTVFVAEVTVLFVLMKVTVPGETIVAVQGVVLVVPPANVTPAGIPAKVSNNCTPCVDAPLLNWD